MDRRIVIDISPALIRVALTEDGRLAEVHYERTESENIVGNIYSGRVVNVLKGMQAAFVDIGLERNAFLSVSQRDAEESAGIEDGDGAGASPQTDGAPGSGLSVSPGDTVMVQVLKDMCGGKGARVSLSLSLPGRFTVLMPTSESIGISRKITDEKTCARLLAAAESLRPKGMGIIMRTAAADAGEKELRRDVEGLLSQWKSICALAPNAPPHTVLHRESGLMMRTLRDMFTPDVAEIAVTDIAAKAQIEAFLAGLGLKKHCAVTLCAGRDLFIERGLLPQLDAMLCRRVPISSGAYLVIEKTEALTVIDVNTGKYTGSDNLEQTVFDTNMLAASEIARQLRLRNIGGIVVCDFIDMSREAHRTALLSHLENELKKDRLRASVMGMSALGLVEITRKKTRNETAAHLLQPCPYCDGEGALYSAGHVTAHILAAVTASLRKKGIKGLLVFAHPAVVVKLARDPHLLPALPGRGFRLYAYAAASDSVTHFRVQEFFEDVFEVPDAARLLR